MTIKTVFNKVIDGRLINVLHSDEKFPHWSYEGKDLPYMGVVRKTYNSSVGATVKSHGFYFGRYALWVSNCFLKQKNK